MARRISVVVSQSQSQNPARRQLEEDLVGALLMEPGVDVIVVPHLYDLAADGTGVLALQGIGGNLIVLSWLYERAARWTLDRHDVRGQIGVSLIKPSNDEEDDEDEDESSEQADAEPKERVFDSRPTPARRIYCIDLRIHADAKKYVDEIRRIANENSQQVVSIDFGGLAPAPTKTDAVKPGAIKPETLARFSIPTNDTALPLTPAVPPAAVAPQATESAAPQLIRVEESAARRWYPVIDYTRCTNCMECIDFCLFGVYGVDKVETILVEQPDNCRKGCPACSRVCPENAIIFPQHKTPGIAGADIAAGGALKIDLSRLFGAPETGEDAVAAALRERDEQLVAAGRDAVGDTVGVPKSVKAAANAGPKDELDDLIDRLDELDL